MRFIYIDQAGRMVEVRSLEGLAARLELGAINSSTLLYDVVSDRWAPAAAHEFFRTIARPAAKEGGLPVTPPGLTPSPDTLPPAVHPAVEDSPGGGGEPTGEEDPPDTPPAEGAGPLTPLPEVPEGEFGEPTGDGRREPSEPSVLPRDGLSAPNQLFQWLESDEKGESAGAAGGLLEDELGLTHIPDFSGGGTPPPEPDPGAGVPTESELEVEMHPSLREASPADPLPHPTPPMEGLAPPDATHPSLEPGDRGDGSQEPDVAEDPFMVERGWAWEADHPPAGPTGPSPGFGEPSPPGDPADGSLPAPPPRARAPQRSPHRPAPRPSRGFPLGRGLALLALVAVSAWFVVDQWTWRAEAPVAVVPPELATTLSAVGGDAFRGMLEAVDSLASLRGLPPTPGPEWLEGIYLAYASRFPGVGAYWTAVGDFVEGIRTSEDALFRARLEAKVGALDLPGSSREILLEAGLGHFERSRLPRLRVYAELEGIARTAADLHQLLVEREDDIDYEPFTVSGVSRDPVIEAVPTDPPLAERMWSSIDRVTRGLQGLEALEAVSTRGILDALERELARAGWR